ncbi:hypothetical protein GCM10020254_16360 [Streptomyces goshikiensis]
MDKPMPHSEPERRTVFDNLKAKSGTRRWAPIDTLPWPWPVSRAARLPSRPDSRWDGPPIRIRARRKRTRSTQRRSRTRSGRRLALLRSLELAAELTVPSGFDQNLAAEAPRTGNRIRDPLTLPWTRN